MAIVNVNDKYVDAVADVSKEVAFVDGDSEATHQATVPAGESWLILGAVATITTTAETGNRTHSLRVTDGSDAFYQTAVGANLAASQTDAKRRFVIGASTAGELVALAANVYAPAGSVVDVKDIAGIDEAAPADTIEIKLLVQKTYEAN
jgi:hypothetical protein